MTNNDALEQANRYTMLNDRSGGLSRTDRDILWDIAEDNIFTAFRYAYSLGFQKGREDPKK